MVIRFMPQGNPLFLERLKPLVVNVQPGACGILWHIVPEDVAHVVEELCGRKQKAGRPRLALLHALFEKLRIGVALHCRSPEPAIGDVLILPHTLSHQVQLAQQILRPGVLCLCRLMKIFRRRICVFEYMISFEILLSQGVGSIVVYVLRRRIQPPDALTEIVYVSITREKQFSKRTLSSRQFLPGRCSSQCLAFSASGISSPPSRYSCPRKVWA